MKRPRIETSIEAYNSLKPETLRDTYQNILNALTVLKEASSEQIATYLNVEHSKIHKRTSEMEREPYKLIFRPGHKVPSKSGRNCYVWQIREVYSKEVAPEKYTSKTVSASDHANNILRGNLVQKNLF